MAKYKPTSVYTEYRGHFITPAWCSGLPAGFFVRDPNGKIVSANAISEKHGKRIIDEECAEKKSTSDREE